MITFTIPADFKIETVNRMKQLELKYPDNRIREVFGNISGNGWSSGHGALPKQHFVDSVEELERYIRELERYEYDFNYTFNAECLENKDITQKGLQEIRAFVQTLYDAGVKRITVASPALIAYLSKEFPKLKITVSSITNVDSVIRAKEMERLGADTIVYGEDITRNFEVLQSIRRHTRPHTEIIVNSKCTFNCAYRVFHYASVNHDTAGEQVLFSYGKNCAECRREDPVQYIKSLWIRPEDLEIYAANGVDLFKLIGREQLNKINLLKMVETYFSREYNGNLLDLIFGFDTTVKHAYIDNRKLDGFIEKFVQQPFRCLSECTEDQCRYCESYFRKSWVKE